MITLNSERENNILIKELFKIDILEELKKLDCILAGGAITSVFCSRKINDYDIYFKTKESLNLLSRWLMSKGEFSLVYQSELALTFKHEENNVTIQLILLPNLIIATSMEKLIQNFDFSVCMGAYEFKTQKFYLNDMFFIHNSQRRLVFNPLSKFPICALYRTKKYIKKGYTLAGSEMIKIALCINKLNIKTFGDLKKHLKGIDTFLLKEITDSLVDTEVFDLDKFFKLIESVEPNTSSYLDEAIG